MYAIPNLFFFSFESWDVLNYDFSGFLLLELVFSC
jgi:hypothetical protein